jgi:hypothetical protein
MNVVFGIINREAVDVEDASVHFAAMIRSVFEIDFFRVLPFQGVYRVKADVGQVLRHVLPDAGYAFEFGFHPVALPLVLSWWQLFFSEIIASSGLFRSFPM